MKSTRANQTETKSPPYTSDEHKAKKKRTGVVGRHRKFKPCTFVHKS